MPRPSTGPLAQQYACFCGDTHPRHTRIFNMDVLVCPEVQGPTLRLVQMTRAWVTKTDPKTKESARELSPPRRHPGYLVVGSGPEADTPEVLHANVEKLIGEMKHASDDMLAAIATLQTANSVLAERVAALEKRREKA